MPAATFNETKSPPSSTTLLGKLVNIFVSPGEVFDEIAVAPPKLVNWFVPTLLVCLTGTFSPSGAPPGESTASALGQLCTVCLAVLAGTIWSAFVLWFTGRVFLRVRFPFAKAVEVVGLSGMILVLGTIITALLVQVSGDAGARPSLALLISGSGIGHRGLGLLEALNFFHLWTATVLAIGLSKLSGVSFKESAFWVFGYWVLSRIALILLA
jgi:hypothetical protein